jgi:DNA ligase-1
MKEFVQLFEELDSYTGTNDRIVALLRYFKVASDQDKLWCIALLSGRRPKRSVNTGLLRSWAAEIAHIPDWLFEESYHTVGDLAETISILVPGQNSFQPYKNETLNQWMEAIQSLHGVSEQEKKEFVTAAWKNMDASGRFVFNKLITGGFRIGVSQKIIVKALSRFLFKPENEIAHALMGNWSPATVDFDELLIQAKGDNSKPYPFSLAYALDISTDQLGETEQWSAEWKWDGIRSQIIVRDAQIYIWSRGEELITDCFPEFNHLKDIVPDGTVIDAELLAHNDNEILPFQLLQTRITRKTVSPKLLKEAPVKLFAYDILEWNKQDIREWSFHDRRKKLESVVMMANSSSLLVSPLLPFSDWQRLHALRNQSRQMQAEGLMLKRNNSSYHSGRKRGDWWKWKVDALSIDAVLIYAMKGHGRRANLYTDYTFAVWNGTELLPFAKAYSGLSDEEFRKVDAFVKSNTTERFGPVRGVVPELVFEIAFEGISKSGRHKSGIALRFPRIKRWRSDKPAQEANTLEDLRIMLEMYGS